MNIQLNKLQIKYDSLLSLYNKIYVNCLIIAFLSALFSILIKDNVINEVTSAINSITKILVVTCVILSAVIGLKFFYLHRKIPSYYKNTFLYLKKLLKIWLIAAFCSLLSFSVSKPVVDKTIFIIDIISKIAFTSCAVILIGGYVTLKIMKYLINRTSQKSEA